MTNYVSGTYMIFRPCDLLKNVYHTLAEFLKFCPKIMRIFCLLTTSKSSRISNSKFKYLKFYTDYNFLPIPTTELLL